jgi:hypothetical protein
MNEALESIIIGNLQKDVAYMFFVFDKRNNVDEDIVFDLNRLRSAYFTNPQELLSHILQIITFMNRSEDILEIMPMIDDYVEFICRDADEEMNDNENLHVKIPISENEIVNNKKDYFGDFEQELADADMD